VADRSPRTADMSTPMRSGYSSSTKGSH
jgi:hypothetical protein